MGNKEFIYNICIGGVSFEVETPFELQWKKEDLQFLSANMICEHKITIGNSEPLSDEVGQPVYTNQEMAVYGDFEKQIRHYFMLPYGNRCLSSQYNDGNIKITVPFKGAGIMEVKHHIWDYIFLEKVLLEHQGLILHCAYTEYNGRAICYTAPSGTGKTTQATHWVNKYGAEILNGDKALLKLDGAEWYVHGYPFHGSATECINRKAKLDTIVILRQSKENRIEELSDIDKIRLIYSEITSNVWDSQAVFEILSLLEDMVKKVRVIKFHCTKYEESAEVLHRYLYGGTE